MRILWIVNMMPAALAGFLNIKSNVFGGWVESMAANLKAYDDITLAIACKNETAVDFAPTDIDGVRYYSVKYNGKTSVEELDKICDGIISEFKPDLIQIEGTEFQHAKSMLNKALALNIPHVVSVQGILNGQYQYQCGQLQIDDMMFSSSIKKITAAWILHIRKTRWYKKRLPYERETISKAKNILGRTTWDRAHSYKLNPTARYYSCPRVLREPFYRHNWNIDNIERHSLYAGNGYYALKGVHYLIEALPQLKREFPDIKLYIAGHKPFFKGDRRPFFKKGYGLYLEKLIKDLGVEENVEFMGPLSATEVAERLEKTHIYVLTSAVENSPNTLGEAMCIGTPCVASYVGGVPDMVDDGRDALVYRNDDSALLAWKIKQIFDDDDLAKALSANGKKRAAVTHSPQLNVKKLHDIYLSILNSKGD